MTGSAGELLHQWRLARGLTLGGLAARSGVHTSTLSRWEAGKQYPSLRELDAVLKALDASARQRREVLQRLEAPRAVQRVRSETQHSPPVGGDLLRAMRMRRGWTQAETAQRVGTTQSTLAKWERSEDWPTPERMHALCYALEAHPEEISVLTTRHFWLASEPESAVDLEAMKSRMASVYHQRDHLSDLQFLSLEAELWRIAVHSPSAHALLRLVSSYHARVLLETGRFLEAETIMRRLQAETPPDEEDQATFPQNALIAASLSARRSPSRAVSLLKDALGKVDNVDYRSWMLGDIGIYLAQTGRDEATQVIEVACRVTERSPEMTLPSFRRRDQARALITLKRYAEAKTALEAARLLLDYSPDSQVRHYLLEVECLLGLGKRSEAQEYLTMATDTISRHYRDYLRPQADALALRL